MSLPNLRLIFFRLSLITAVLTVLFFTLTDDVPSVTQEVNDKVAHLLAFMMLALLTDYSFPGTGFNLRKSLPLVFYGMLIECIQYFLPYRTFSMLDFLADCSGVYLYPLVQIWLGRLFALKKR